MGPKHIKVSSYTSQRGTGKNYCPRLFKKEIKTKRIRTMVIKVDSFASVYEDRENLNISRVTRNPTGLYIVPKRIIEQTRFARVRIRSGFALMSKIRANIE